MIDYKILCSTIVAWKSGHRRLTGSFQALQLDASHEPKVDANSNPNESWDTEDVPMRRNSPSEERTKEIPTEWSDDEDQS